MATPRSRWIRVSDLVLDEDWNDATLATTVRLLAWMRQRWAREKLTSEQACEAMISGREAMRITRCERPHVALQRLASLPLAAGWSSASASLVKRQSGAAVLLKWPKVAEYQGWDTRESGDAKPDTRPLRRSGVPAPDARKKREESEVETPAAPATTANGHAAHHPLTDPQWTELRAWADQMVLAGKLPATGSDPAWLADQLERCADHWAAKGKRISRWPAAVRNWIRKAEEFRARDAPAKAAEQGVLAAFVARGARGGH